MSIEIFFIFQVNGIIKKSSNIQFANWPQLSTSVDLCKSSQCYYIWANASLTLWDDYLHCKFFLKIPWIICHLMSKCQLWLHAVRCWRFNKIQQKREKKILFVKKRICEKKEECGFDIVTKIFVPSICLKIIYQVSFLLLQLQTPQKRFFNVFIIKTSLQFVIEFRHAQV